MADRIVAIFPGEDGVEKVVAAPDLRTQVTELGNLVDCGDGSYKVWLNPDIRAQLIQRHISPKDVEERLAFDAQAIKAAVK